MKAPLILVTAALTIAILVVASFLIATGRRDESMLRQLIQDPIEQIFHLPLDPQSISFDQKDTKAVPARPTVP
jgi:predicted membrane-bound spermidine synthase